ncbi:MAG TPA: hypothetical protein VHO48_05490, partial [Anaerolineaceae bacterium]|nr:hypothetical protein [Anaerolineaceae bacterium]
MRLHHRIIATVVLLALTACGQSSPSVVPSSTPEVSAPVEAQDLPDPTLPALEPTAAPVEAAEAPTQSPAAALRELPAFADLWTNNAQGEILALS